MKIFDVNISPEIIDFFQMDLEKEEDYLSANKLVYTVCGINDFFIDNENYFELKNIVSEHISVVEEPNRRAYGDYQTNKNLAENVINRVYTENFYPQFILEPTCGKGRFIHEALKCFDSIEVIVGIEIHAPYVWETKFGILEMFLKKENQCHPDIYILQADIFTFDLKRLGNKYSHFKTLVVGNPPWVTNAELGALNSTNLPAKSNFKGAKGLDAITGKGNFDIGEYITIQILKIFHQCEGRFAFLVKGIVVKNIIQNQQKNKYHIGEIKQWNIDAKKEFNVSVNACLFTTSFDKLPESICAELDFYTLDKKTEFGWWEEKFVYNIHQYKSTKNIEGKSPFVWRQGMKHDCSKVMELDSINGHFINGFKEELNPEKDLIHGLLKSSDLKNEIIKTHRKSTIVTQKRIGQDTNYIKQNFPKTYQYLHNNREYFERRKSSIYRGKPPFSIFGIGDYSFAKYKVAISGMYKRTTFSLVLPDEDKPVMLDDTCYFIGFDSLETATVVQKILNSDLVQSFLKSIIFPNAKRPITKDILMRIDIGKAYQLLMSSMRFTDDNDWIAFGEKLKTVNKESGQMTLF